MAYQISNIISRADDNLACMARMAAAQGTDLRDVSGECDLLALAAAARACALCREDVRCRAWLGETSAPVTARAFCRNYRLFRRLSAAARGGG